ncbi:MAG: hypothetical protein R3A13_06965 [Bdellovibrionota bacterium]
MKAIWKESLNNEEAAFFHICKTAGAKEYESVSMWNQYVSNLEGVVIQSTYNRLIDALQSYQDLDVYVGTVNPYRLPKRSCSGTEYFSHPYKRRSFEHMKMK